MQEDITVYVENAAGERVAVPVPTDMGLSLMEALKANEFDILATCGGMALCATCHVELVEAPELPEPSDDELYMLENLPNLRDGSRLSCQIKITPELDGTVLRLMSDH
ncbi:2Fe-2S iron-sulfur cluster-binding protein [Rufibacter glacialis]|uniref:2Fe-2S iron-sulfur cluster binding domain-containing protein n=1 Tax=Rufibacter glacialis TaxID=1259555 RepID=A0A5M8QND0_9BACT|nr:2Fe-2S iron-sulfur cluster-binding protein [Rufibacter glacialis]KAA6437589.1 2Fe-2S iron-sulfur cluster binding domain-containing protein [Rufibacter glacialis]GGK58060.1 ferredoxin [Rufibacter glacialis]